MVLGLYIMYMGFHDKKPDRSFTITPSIKVPEVSTLEFSLKSGKEINTVMWIKEGKFFWKGEEVTDKYKVYERFNEWLSKAETEYEKRQPLNILDTKGNTLYAENKDGYVLIEPTEIKDEKK